MSRSLVRVGLEVAKLPKVEITLSGGPLCRAQFESFKARHPRLPLVEKKRWGLALLPLPDTFDTYFMEPDRSLMRRKHRRATKRGYRVDGFDGPSRLEEIMAINASAPLRQGRPIDDQYLDQEVFARSLVDRPRLTGVFTADDELVAYAEVPVCGDLFEVSRILGHDALQEDGIMYLLIGEIVRRMIDLRSAQGRPTWGMYDTMVGAQAGLRFFKERLGFQPYNARWVWEQDVEGPA